MQAGAAPLSKYSTKAQPGIFQLPITGWMLRLLKPVETRSILTIQKTKMTLAHCRFVHDTVGTGSL